jgi:hypothetical protein
MEVSCEKKSTGISLDIGLYFPRVSKLVQASVKTQGEILQALAV